MSLIEELADIFDVVIRQYRLEGARGYTQKFANGYLILIDDRLTGRAQERTLTHEMLHITLGHLDDRIDLSEEDKEEEVRTALRAMGY